MAIGSQVFIASNVTSMHINIKKSIPTHIGLIAYVTTAAAAESDISRRGRVCCKLCHTPTLPDTLIFQCIYKYISICQPETTSPITLSGNLTACQCCRKWCCKVFEFCDLEYYWYLWVWRWVAIKQPPGQRSNQLCWAEVQLWKRTKVYNLNGADCWLHE